MVELIHAPKPNFVFIGGWDSAVVGGGERGRGLGRSGEWFRGRKRSSPAVALAFFCLTTFLSVSGVASQR